MTYISAALRREVIARAGNCCEYCRINQEDRFFSYEIDHIIAEKHSGLTIESNLCWSCYICNGYKGSDLSSIDWDGTGEIAPLFNPRKHLWNEHFQLKGALIVPRTAEGRVTAFLLRFNAAERVNERELLIRAKRYPCVADTE